MVNLTRIYTRTGDDGTTGLGDFSRTRKTDPRLAAYADVNEANAVLGVVLATGTLGEDVRAILTRVQNDLFDVGADLCTPLLANPEYPPLRVQGAWIEELEADCDAQNAKLDALRSFILPGGTVAAAHLHQATTVVRRVHGQGRVWGQPRDRGLPQPALGPALHPRASGQPRPGRRRPVAARRRTSRGTREEAPARGPGGSEDRGLLTRARAERDQATLTLYPGGELSSQARTAV